MVITASVFDNSRVWHRAGMAVAMALALYLVPAALRAQTTAAGNAATSRSALQWMQRWQQAAATHAYAGTVSMMSERGQLRSARVWHAVHNGQQIDRMEMLSGPPRTIVRSGRSVTTLFSADKRARVLHDAPHAPGLFPGMDVLNAAQLQTAAGYYDAALVGRERMANYLADVVVFKPRDNWRNSYRFWSEEKTGVLLKWQMLASDKDGKADTRVLREAGFSDVQIPAVVEFASLKALLDERQGYAAVEHRLQNQTLQSHGWGWRKPLPGYVVTGCYERGQRGAGLSGRNAKAGHGEGRGEGRGMGRGMRSGEGTESGEMGGGMDMQKRRFAGGTAVQCLVTDGLGSMSLFIEKFSQKPPAHTTDKSADRSMENADLRMLSRWYDDTYRITAVGTLPAAALQGVLDSLYRP